MRFQAAVRELSQQDADLDVVAKRFLARCRIPVAIPVKRLQPRRDVTVEVIIQQLLKETSRSGLRDRLMMTDRHPPCFQAFI